MPRTELLFVIPMGIFFVIMNELASALLSKVRARGTLHSIDDKRCWIIQGSLKWLAIDLPLASLGCWLFPSGTVRILELLPILLLLRTGWFWTRSQSLRTAQLGIAGVYSIAFPFACVFPIILGLHLRGY